MVLPSKLILIFSECNTFGPSQETYSKQWIIYSLWAKYISDLVRDKPELYICEVKTQLHMSQEMVFSLYIKGDFTPCFELDWFTSY